MTISIPLRGAGGEPVAFRETLTSHGLAWLPPNAISADETRLETTLLVGRSGARRVRLAEDAAGSIGIDVAGERLSQAERACVVRIVRTMFGLDEDLSAFYARIERDADLHFARTGAGRMLRSPTAFEDVVRTICTTNCAWAGTRRMISAIVTHLGTAASGASSDQWSGHAFPTAAQIADADKTFSATWRARAIAGRISVGSHERSRTARSISKRCATRRPRDSPTTNSSGSCSRYPASDHMRQRTS